MHERGAADRHHVTTTDCEAWTGIELYTLVADTQGMDHALQEPERA